MYVYSLLFVQLLSLSFLLFSFFKQIGTYVVVGISHRLYVEQTGEITCLSIQNSELKQIFGCSRIYIVSKQIDNKKKKKKNIIISTYVHIYYNLLIEHNIILCKPRIKLVEQTFCFHLQTLMENNFRRNENYLSNQENSLRNCNLLGILFLFFCVKFSVLKIIGDFVVGT